MAKRKRKEKSEETSVNVGVVPFTARLFEDGDKLNEIRLACGRLKRIRNPRPEHLEKFIDRVFTIAGVEQGVQATSTGALQG